jgi:hypothetical protein
MTWKCRSSLTIRPRDYLEIFSWRSIREIFCRQFYDTLSASVESCIDWSSYVNPNPSAAITNHPKSWAIYSLKRWAKYSKYSYSSTILPVLVLVLGRSVLVLVLVLEKIRTRPPLIPYADIYHYIIQTVRSVSISSWQANNSYHFLWENDYTLNNRHWYLYNFSHRIFSWRALKNLLLYLNDKNSKKKTDVQQ